MRITTHLAASVLLSALYLGCGAQSSTDPDNESGMFGNAGGAGGAGAAGGTKQPGEGGAAGSATAGSAGSAGNDAGGADDKAQVSAGCQACLRALCSSVCPTSGDECDPCDVPGACDSPPANAAIAECACMAGAKCGDSCTDSPRLCAMTPDISAGGAGGTGGSAGATEGPGTGGSSAAGSGGSSAAGSGGSSAAGSGGSSAAGSGGSDGEGGSPCSAQDEVAQGCADGQDNDCDALVDCDDPQCAGTCAKACAHPTPIKSGQTFNASLKGHQNSFDPTCTAFPATGPDAAYAFTAQQTGILHVLLDSAATNMVLSLRDQCGGSGTDLVCQDAVGVGVEAIDRPVKEGESYFIIVGAALPEQEGDYSLSVAVTVTECGDGQVQAGEECDDGPQNGKNAQCSETCTLLACKNAMGLTDASGPGYEFIGTSGQDTSDGGGALSASCGQLGSTAPEKVFSIRPVRSGQLEVVLEPAPDVDLTLSARSNCNASGAELICVDGARKGGVERLSLPATAGETIYLVVDGYSSGDHGQFTLKARSVPAICGDKIPSMAEQCDAPDDKASCTGRCTAVPLAGDLLDEATLGPDDALPLPGGTAQSEIYPAGDADTYAYKLGPGQTQLTVTISAPGAQGCEQRRLDSQLEILDSQGLLVGFNDDSAEAGGFCSQVVASGLTAGETYRVRVRASQTFAPAQVFSYQLQIEAQ
jgi:cysteine-rich repeat protein